MGITHKKQTQNPQTFENPRLNRNLIRNKVFQGIENAQIILLLWIRLIEIQSYQEKQKQNPKNSYENLWKLTSLYNEQIKRDLPRTFPEDVNLNKKENKESLQKVLTALSNRFPEIGYVSGMSFYVQRVLQIASQQKAYWILVWLYSNDRLIYNATTTPKFMQILFEVITQIVQIECSTLTAVLRHISIDINMFATTWVKTLFSNVCDQKTFNHLFSLALLEGSKVWVFAIVSMIKTLEQKILKSNRSQQKILEITNSRNLFMSPETRTSFLQQLQKLLQKYEKQADEYINRICKVVLLDEEVKILNQGLNRQQSQ